jgi:hypothetical protein
VAGRKSGAVIKAPLDDVGAGLSLLVHRYGSALTGEPHRVRDLLRSRPGFSESEITPLVGAVELGIAGQLARAHDEAIPPRRFDELAVTLGWWCGIPAGEARWAVEAWARALDVDEPTDPGYPQIIDDLAKPPLRERAPLWLRYHALPLTVGALVAALAVAIVAAMLTAPEPSAETLARPNPTLAAADAAVPTITIPDLVGGSRHDATTQLRAAGLRWEIGSEHTERADAGTVLRQRPAAGVAIEEGSVVTLVVATPLVPVGTPRHVRFDKTTTSVTMTWAEPGGGSTVEHYEIWRDGERVGDRRPDHRAFTDGGLLAGSAHRYRVVAVGRNGTEARSSWRTIHLRVPPPPPSPSASSAPASVAAPAANPPPPPPPSPTPCTAPDPDFC